MAEVRIGINRDFEQTGYFDNDVWCRAVIDLIIYDEDRALIVDWKTGKVKPDFSQLDVMAAMTKCLIPSLRKVVGLYYWLKGKRITKKVYNEPDFKEAWHDILPRVRRFQAMVRAEDFKPTPNFLCRNYCRVTTCEYHGK